MTATSKQHRGLLPFLGLASGASVAAIYYNQPLLYEISRSFHVSSAHAGTVAVATQLGYAMGILLFVPLGDVAERRRLITILFGAVGLAMLVAAAAPSLVMLGVASVVIGMTAAVTHVIVPIAPELVPAEQSGRAIGTVMTGLLLGILFSRTAAGWLATLVGWRGVFVVAGGFTLLFVPLMRWRLPKLPPTHPVPYGKALASLWRLTVEQPALREASAVGFLCFAAFSSFWTTLAFLLSTPPYHLGAGAAGSFGVLGAAGALAAGFAGRLSDRRGARFVVLVGILLLSAAYVELWAAGYSLAGLVVGVLVLDLGQQTMQISNQTRIFSLVVGARSRLNTVYMIVFFLGGAAGSAASTWAWSKWQWNGVCAMALLFLAAALVVHATGGRRRAVAE